MDFNKSLRNKKFPHLLYSIMEILAIYATINTTHFIKIILTLYIFYVDEL
tara:strand:- start:294 stop:443 length:150 start_codon:yes stop_codon:yes gene_type:complete